MELFFKPLGCEIRGVDLKIENKPESKIIFQLTKLNFHYDFGEVRF